MTHAHRFFLPMLLVALLMPSLAWAQETGSSSTAQATETNTSPQKSDAAAATQGPWPHTRDSWMLGISLGAGPGNLYSSVNDETMQEWAGVVQLRGGGMIHPKLLFSVELDGWLRNVTTGYDTSAKVDMYQYALVLTYYPFDPASSSGGWWLRGGGGLANVRVESDGSFAVDSYSEGGWAMLLAIGYELRVSRTVALGLGVSYEGLGVSGDVFSDSRFLAITLDLNWYSQ